MVRSSSLDMSPHSTLEKCKKKPDCLHLTIILAPILASVQCTGSDSLNPVRPLNESCCPQIRHEWARINGIFTSSTCFKVSDTFISCDIMLIRQLLRKWITCCSRLFFLWFRYVANGVYHTLN